MTRLATLLTNSSYRHKASWCNKIHLHSFITNKKKSLLGVSDCLHHKGETNDVGTQSKDNNQLS